ncbi:MAG: HYR domain-containing protein, partial [Bacteroidota bacterium]
AINFTGNGSADGNGFNYGIRLQNSGTSVTTMDGLINMQGTGGGDGMQSGNFNTGVLIITSALVEATGSGSIMINGQGGQSTGSFNRGVDVESSAIIRSNGGGISINGTGGIGNSQAMGIVFINGPTVEDTNGGSITMNGVGGSGTGNFYGGLIVNNTNINATNGNISMTGIGGTGVGNLELGVRILNNASVQTTGSGMITIDGTGGMGSTDNFGTQMASGALISTEDGNINISGVATDNTGSNQYGLRLSGTFTTTGTGSILLNGTSGGTNTRDISIDSSDTLISANNGDVTLTGTNGFGIITPSGIPPADIIVGNQVFFNGDVRPGNTAGNNVGLLPMNGNLQMANDDVLIFNFRDFNTAGIDYDQVVVTGTVDITDAALALVDNTGTSENECASLVLIDNDGTDAIIGTFNGLSEGDSVTFGGITGKVSYVGGDGNDFVLNLDDTAPTIACPSDLIVSNDLGLCSAVVTFADALALDNCGVATVVQTGGLPSGSDFPVGVSTIEFTATDINGNTAVCSFTITVEDNEAPVAVCQDITIQLDEMGMATITAADVSGVSTDNCGVATSSIDINTFDCSHVGANNVTLTVTDVNGNSSTCVAAVTVEDITVPEVTCLDITVQLDANGSVTISPADVIVSTSDACGITSASLDIDTFDCSNVGENTVVVTVTDVNGNEGSCTAVVTVEDITSPELICQDITVALDENGFAEITPEDVILSNTDACGILTTAVDIFEFNCDDIGSPVTVQVFTEDVNGNLATCFATVTVVDELAPVITCPADTTVDPGAGQQLYEVPDYWALGEATATDNCTDPVTITSQDPAPGTFLVDGIYTVTLSAEDAYGNVGSCEFELTVESILGINDPEIDLSTIVLYPNPANNQVNLSNPQNIDLREVTLYDVTGRLVKTFNLKDMGAEKILDISNLANATYLVLITSEHGQLTKQLIKE